MHEMHRPGHHTMNNQDGTGDRQADSLVDGRWMTFAELSQSRGISKTSAMKLVSRHGWRRQKNNKGQVRALVPVAWVRAEDTKEPNSAADMSRAIRAFDSAIATLREQLARETRRTEAAERARTALTVQLAQAEAGRAAERSRAEAEREARTRAEAEAEALRAQLDQARAEAQQATQAAEAEAARLRQATELAVQEAKELREAEAARAAREETANRSTVASKIDEVQLRRLQEAEQARRSRSRLQRLRAAWWAE
jgi:chromosome segregation ATPase